MMDETSDTFFFDSAKIFAESAKIFAESAKIFAEAQEKQKDKDAISLLVEATVCAEMASTYAAECQFDFLETAKSILIANRAIKSSHKKSRRLDKVILKYDKSSSEARSWL